MSFQDTAFIFFIALLLFGPKKLPELARYVGKLMGEFRRASSEFRMQMEDEMRVSEQAEQQKKIAAMEAAAPVTPLLDTSEPAQLPVESADSIASADPTSLESEPSTDPYAIAESEIPVSDAERHSGQEPESPHLPLSQQAPLPIASSGDLDMMPPATGLPVGRSASSSSMNGLFDSIPHTDPTPEPETATHG